ncbi:hypothetical protein [Candidatus Chloroploca asiatica]|uniref:hypothetical protein n=1 Tax=Candidatus Chloroploca asiatica TaxID=1506545 RepID=UPI0011418D5E|nr:hypothetical protein [Candidatus Chloroploca asiatica]
MQHMLALVGYLLVTLLSFTPLLPHVGKALFGGPIAGADGWQNVWHVWWTAQAVTTGQNPFVTPLLFHPQGALLYVQPLNVSNGLLVLPVTLLFGPVAGYNTATMLSFVLAGLAGYLLALRVTGAHLPAWIGGLAFAWAPFQLTRLYDGQLELMAVQWPALYAFFALRAVETRRVRDALLAGLMLAVTGYTSWYYLLFLLVWSAAFALLWLPHGVGKTGVAWADASLHPEESERARRDPTLAQRHPQLLGQYGVWLRQWMVIGLTALLLLTPVLLPALLSLYGAERDLAKVDPEEVRIYSANLLDFALPSYLHPLWGPTVAATAGAAWHPLSADWNVALGYSIVVLAGMGCCWAWRQAWRWLVLATIGLLFALGPVLQIGVWNTGLPLPYRLLHILPGTDFALRPMRFTMLTTLALAPLTALGVRELLLRGQRIKTKKLGPSLTRLLIVVTVLIVLGFELLPMRWKLHVPTIHPVYATLNSKDEAVLHVPPPTYKRIKPQKAQMTHQAPMLGGYLARTPQYDLPYAPGIRPLWHKHPEISTMLDPQGTAQTSLNYYGIRHLIVNWPDIHPDRRPRVAQAMAEVLPDEVPVYSDEHLSVYKVPLVELVPFAYFGSGWYDEEQNEVERWRWMGAQGDIMLVNAASTPQRVRILLNLASYAEARDVTIWLDRVPLATRTIPAQPASAVRTLYLLLDPGEHRLTLNATTAKEVSSTSQRELSLVLSGIELVWLQTME